MCLGRSIGITIVGALISLALASPGLADSPWIDISKQAEAAPPPIHEEWLSLFPSINAITISPGGRLVAVGNDGTVMLSGADPNEHWTRVTSNTDRNLTAVAIEPKSGRLIA